MSTIRLFLADDHALLREGLRLILDSHPDMRVVGEAADGLEAVRQVAELLPQAVLMDISMGKLNGIKATAQITERCPSVKVIMLSMHSSSEHVRQALKAGAKGYLLKESVGKEVIEAVQQVVAGQWYFSPRITDHLFSGPTFQGSGFIALSAFDQLSARERVVLQLLVEGHAGKEIAQKLGISPKTIDTYRKRLMEKLQVDNLPALVLFCIHHGFLHSEE